MQNPVVTLAWLFGNLQLVAPFHRNGYWHKAVLCVTIAHQTYTGVDTCVHHLGVCGNLSRIGFFNPLNFFNYSQSFRLQFGGQCFGGIVVYSTYITLFRRLMLWYGRCRLSPAWASMHAKYAPRVRQPDFPASMVPFDHELACCSDWLWETRSEAFFFCKHYVLTLWWCCSGLMSLQCWLIWCMWKSLTSIVIDMMMVDVILIGVLAMTMYCLTEAHTQNITYYSHSSYMVTALQI